MNEGKISHYFSKPWDNQELITELNSAYELFINEKKTQQLLKINLAKNANLQYDDFYDWTHLNKQGSAKAANFIYENLLNNIFKN